MPRATISPRARMTFAGQDLYRCTAAEIQLFNDDGTPGSSFWYNPRRSFRERSKARRRLECEQC